MTAVRRVVLDTNVVLSALVFAQGQLAPLRQAWQQCRCHPLVSTTTTAELMRALRYPKFKLSVEEQGELLADHFALLRHRAHSRQATKDAALS